MPLTKRREGPIERGRRLREEARLRQKQQRDDWYAENPHRVLPQPGVGEGWSAGSEGHTGLQPPVEYPIEDYPPQEPGGGLFGIGSQMPTMPDWGRLLGAAEKYGRYGGHIGGRMLGPSPTAEGSPGSYGASVARAQAPNGYYRPWGSEQMVPIPDDHSQMILSEADWTAAQSGGDIGGLARR